LTYQKQNRQIQFKDLGLISYQRAWDLQEEHLQELVKIKLNAGGMENSAITPNHLFFCEHPHVYTLGKSGKREHLLIEEANLAHYQAEYFPINRGGDITYHGPGQLVAYPILDLENFFTDIHKYMRALEEAVILTCVHFGLDAGRVDGLTGVWIAPSSTNPRKICAMGVKTSRWVTMHGLALNVNTDLSYFGHIVPCGITDKAVTSMQLELGEQLEMAAVKEVLKQNFCAVFEAELREVS
jgi:lipoyl(octanoyl) transferase